MLVIDIVVPEKDREYRKRVIDVQWTISHPSIRNTILSRIKVQRLGGELGKAITYPRALGKLDILKSSRRYSLNVIGNYENI